jgi:hypothetical protein
MNVRKIDFSDLDWQQEEHLRFKERRLGSHKIRLIEYSSGFQQENWCKRAHTGYVLEGSIKIEFAGESVQYVKGDGIFIRSGDEDRHRAHVA